MAGTLFAMTQHGIIKLELKRYLKEKIKTKKNPQMNCMYNLTLSDNN